MVNVRESILHCGACQFYEYRLTVSTHSAQDGTNSEWISQAEAARLRGVTRQSIAKLVRKGRFRTLSVGGHIFVLRRDVLDYEPQSAGRPKTTP